MRETIDAKFSSQAESLSIVNEKVSSLPHSSKVDLVIESLKDTKMSTLTGIESVSDTLKKILDSTSGMEDTLSSKYLWMVVDGTEPCPAVPVAKDGGPFTDAKLAQLQRVQDWIAKDKAARSIIRNGCDVSQWPHITDCTTSKDLWDTLRKFHRDNQLDIDIHYYFGELFTRKYVEGSSMANHIATLRDLQHRITAAGESIPDIYVARALALSLPKTPAWEVIKIQLLSMKPLTADNVGAVLQAEANWRERDKTGGSMALFTSEKPKKGKGKGSKGKDSQSSPKPMDECQYCKHLGHWADKCPQ